MKLFAVALAGCALAVAAAGGIAVPATPAPFASPFVIGTLQPFGSESPLPKIGGTKALRPSCAVMRTLIIPSFQAAQRNDARYVETRKRIPQYVDVTEDPSHQDDGYPAMVLNKLDQDATELLQNSLEISKALGDPAFETHKNDPEVIAEKRALQQLYDAQKIRANLIADFVMREQVALSKRDTAATSSAFLGRTQTLGVSPPPMALPQLTPAPGMAFARSGIPLADKARAADWSTTMAAFVRDKENQAAKTFFTIANTCK